jgi:hypothetical protein
MKGFDGCLIVVGWTKEFPEHSLSAFALLCFGLFVGNFPDLRATC